MSQRDGPIAAQRARNVRFTQQTHELAAADGRALPVILLPANTRRITALPNESRSAFIDTLRGVLDVTFIQPLRDNDAPMSEAEHAARSDAGTPRAALPEQSPNAIGAQVKNLSDVLGASCATCMGECCNSGGTHAFLQVDSLTRVRAQLEQDGIATTRDSLETLYASYLPAQHYRESCVYHTRSGCALPRAMRSNLCNRYVCGSLSQLTRAMESEGVAEAYVGAADSVQLRRVAHVSRDGARGLPLTK
jgi:hypothetical protein